MTPHTAATRTSQKTSSTRPDVRAPTQQTRLKSVEQTKTWAPILWMPKFNMRSETDIVDMGAQRAKETRYISLVLGRSQRFNSSLSNCCIIYLLHYNLDMDSHHEGFFGPEFWWLWLGTTSVAGMAMVLAVSWHFPSGIQIQKCRRITPSWYSHSLLLISDRIPFTGNNQGL